MSKNALGSTWNIRHDAGGEGLDLRVQALTWSL